jgi:hypothetical protein
MKEASMFPWLWFWAPQVHFPLSGAVSQQLDYYDRIPITAGKGNFERRAANTVSYGRQLDAITETLLSLTTPGFLPEDKAAKARARLKENYCEIEKAKALEVADQVKSLAEQLDQLRAEFPEAYQALLRGR